MLYGGENSTFRKSPKERRYIQNGVLRKNCKNVTGNFFFTKERTGEGRKIQNSFLLIFEKVSKFNYKRIDDPSLKYTSDMKRIYNF